MAKLQQSAIRLIEALTDAKLRAISFDLEVEEDNLRYSSWLSALGTAGIALLITNFEEVTPAFAVPHVAAVVTPIVAALSLAASVGVGGFINWSLNTDFSRKRQEMTLYIKQKCLLYSGDAKIEPGDDLFNKITNGQYLSQANQDHLKKLDIASEKRSSERNMLVSQVALLLTGFALAFIGAIRVPTVG